MEKYLYYIYYALVSAPKNHKAYNFVEGFMSLNPFYEDESLWRLILRSEHDAMFEDWHLVGQDMYHSMNKIAK